MPGLEKLNRAGMLVELYREKLLRNYLKTCPTLFHICYDPIGTHKKTRALIGFFLGFFFGVFFYETIVVDLAFEKYTSLALGVVIVTSLSVGCSSSIQVRCICLLTVPSFFGRAGRSVLKALVLGYVIAGPIFNLTVNGKEVVRTFACTTQLTYNLTRTRFDLMFKPFQQAGFNVRTDANEIKDTLSSVRDLTSSIVEEIEGEEETRRLKEENDYVDDSMGDAKRSEEIEERKKKAVAGARTEGEIYEAKYREKVEARCEEQLDKGSEHCREMFGEAYKRCSSAVTWIAAWLLCWPAKLAFVCNVAQALGGPSICDPAGKVDVDVGRNYAALKETRDALGRSFKDARMRYKVQLAPTLVDAYEATDAAKAVMHDFNVRRRLFDGGMVLLKRCLAFVFLKIVLSAQDYHDGYLRDIEHDNVYVTAYFRKIDARRRARGSVALLPLKKMERDKFVDPYSGRPGKAERANLIGQTVKLVLEMVTATTFVLLDRLFYETLDLVRRHARMEYAQSGRHDVKLEIRGTGVIASLLRSVVAGFDLKRRVRTVVSNEACLPRPSQLESYVLGKIYGTYLAVWVTVFLSSYTQRLRRVACSFFYRKREKRRVLYLYNETLRRRLGCLREARARIRALGRARLLDREVGRGMFAWIDLLAPPRPKCLVCGESEPRAGPAGPKFRVCPTPGCPFVSCPECWTDVGQVCLACADPLDTDSEGYETEAEL
ncbi:E3 ubiquitin-protein ligase DCST1 [Orussus abietinus]|uniref:E3 ubiquitin-protein ligase DCST1 n=1 Tax=Orussus abietinus TaxID=222816 RepID=UPI00062697B7|nr:E3 ubiquitin-protein ligase DCST1 [Orussus abietinus]